mmetsp:Transcript_32130/g.91137  ORF Transcript_32130/g.91137 Transcript_32130/m.91137 type:complete len:173 (+) Transcript_32130:148-666(+)
MAARRALSLLAAQRSGYHRELSATAASTFCTTSWVRPSLDGISPPGSLAPPTLLAPITLRPSSLRLPGGAQPTRSRSSSTVAELQGRIDELNDKFVEARDEIELAQDDAETVYFNESVETAKKVVAEVLELWEGVLKDLEPGEKDKLMRGMGLKMEQLKAELEALNHLHDDH